MKHKIWCKDATQPHGDAHMTKHRTGS